VEREGKGQKEESREGEREGRERKGTRLQHRYVEKTSYLTSSKMPFTDKDGHLTKAFQKEKQT